MTFRCELFPTTKDNKYSKYAGLSYYTPRSHNLKRVYPWLTDVTQPGTSSNRKRAFESPCNRPDYMQRSVCPLDKPSNYTLISGQVRGELVSMPSPFLYMDDSSIGAGGMSARRMDFKNPHQGDVSMHSHNLREILKAKVNHVRDFENVVPAPISNSLRKANDGRLLRSAGCNKDYGNFLFMGHPPQIKDGSNTLMDVIHNEGLDLRLTLGRNYEENIVSDRPDEGPKHASGMAIAYNRTIVDYPNYGHLPRTTSQTTTIELNAPQHKIPVNVIRNSGCNAHQTLGCNYKYKGGNAIAFGGVTVVANDEAMVDNRNSAQSSGATSRVGTVGPSARHYSESNSKLGGNAKEQKARREKKPKMVCKPCPNSHLSSISSLLSTGIFDGALVSYICEGRDLLLGGVIKGSKILCSCNQCKNSQYIGSCKFERHAGGKSKRPNCHIYFENGKTIYEVYDELRDASEDKLFDAIQKVAGSAVNQQKFQIWKGQF